MELNSSTAPGVDFSPEAAGMADILSTSAVVTPKNMHALAGMDSTASEDVLSDVSSGYMLRDENKWGWITLYGVTITVAVLGNLLFIIGSQ